MDTRGLRGCIYDFDEGWNSRASDFDQGVDGQAANHAIFIA
jgi:hypothetical protein